MKLKKALATLTSAFMLSSTVCSALAAPNIAASAADADYGDANGDEKIALSDSVLIMQVLGNPDVYGVDGTGDIHISEQGMINADVANVGDGLTNADALAVQEYLLKLIDKLPKE